MSSETGAPGTDDMVRVEFTIKATGQVFLTQEQYEKFEAGDVAAGNYLADQVQMAKDELLLDGSLETTLTRCVLVEADGYLGTDITVLKNF